MNVTDPVSGVSAPVAIRTVRSFKRDPFFVLIGDAEAEPGTPADVRANASRADAEKLFWAFYSNLPSGTFYNLIRLYVAREASGNDGSGGGLAPGEGATLEGMLQLLDARINA